MEPAMGDGPSGQQPSADQLADLRVHFRTVHGYRRAYRIAGSGPPLLLLHGIGDSSVSWVPILDRLAQSFTVIAPDLLGHGNSAKPRADYSVAAYANGMRDLLEILDIERVTVVGHSLGGGVAAQFAYQFPERCERLVLVASGGVGRDVTVMLRALSAPAAELAMVPMQLPVARSMVRLGFGVLRLAGTKLGADADELLRVIEGLPDADARTAFIRTLRSVVDWRGQVVTLRDRAYLAEAMPIQIVWGGRDGVIPVEHAALAAAAMPGSRLEIFDDAGHFPHHADPERFVALLEDFVFETEPMSHEPQRWRDLLVRGARPDVRPAAATVADLLASANAAAAVTEATSGS
ncbi:MAG: alpha/beta hydrolase [Acidimicrobiales bacterium]